jgi:YegS/Rv2252/BmrU family lipid kinase
MTRTIHIIINPAAGQDEIVLATLNKAFHDKDIVWDASITHEKDDGIRLAEAALARGDVDIIAAYGGDGTVGEVANALMGQDVPLAVFAGGTGNAFARALGIPLVLEKAAAMLADESACRVDAVDTGLVEGEIVFIVGGATGIIAETVDGASREEKDRLGITAYTVSALREILAAKPVTYRLMLDGEKIEARGVSCFVGNAGGFGVQGIPFLSDLDLRDGLLDVYLIKDNRANTILNALVDASPLEVPWAKMPHWQAREIRIDADEPGYTFSFDGDYQRPLPVDIEARPGFLKVIVPAKPVDPTG